MIAINNSKVEKAITLFKTDIDYIIKDRLQQIKDLLDNPTHIYKGSKTSFVLRGSNKKYLELLIGEFKEIIRADTIELKKYQVKFDGIISFQQMKCTSNKIFRNELVKRMGYKVHRDVFYPKYFKQIGIKSCVYCNSLLAVTVRNVGQNKKAKFQVDHFYPKMDYPCFSISFYNLYPSCGPCNNGKSTRIVDFDLYSSDYNKLKKSGFSFELDKKSLLKYRLNGTESLLEIIFNEPTGSNFKSTFDIEGIYETQKDVAEELVLKSMIYTKEYRESLKSSFINLYANKTPMVNRLIIGNYSDERDIHKRPLAKFTMDIAKQLKLI